ncbi:MAG: hypothetical protein KGO98_05840 [Rickettsiales bacterium]|nr:hypothetical protein [Rickettsiales bacterium]
MTQAINQKVLSKSGRTLVKHGYWKTKHSEGMWNNGKQVGKHIYYSGQDITEIVLYTNNGDGQRILGIEYKNSWHGDKNGKVFWATAYNVKSRGNESIAWDRQYPDRESKCHNLELVEELLDANEDILMGCKSAH